MTVHLIAALGRRGQVGRDGSLPWQAPEDLAWFRRQTMGSAVIVGGRTFASLPRLPGREVFPFDGTIAPADMIRSIHSGYQRTIWIAGGAATWRAFAPLVTGLRLLSLVDYDSDPADDARHTFFPFDAYGIDWRTA